MSDTNRTQLSVKKESTFATPLTGVSYDLVRFTSESFKQQTQTQESAEIRSDRNVANVMRSSFSAAGDIGFELAFGGVNSAQDMLMAAALQVSGAAFAVGNADTAGATTISWDKDTLTFTDSANGFGNFDVGKWVKIWDSAGDFSDEPVYAKVTAKTNGTLTVTSITAARGSLVAVVPEDFSSGTEMNIVEADTAVNGTALSSFTFERKYNDLTTTYAGFKGMCVDSLSVSVSANSIITGSFGFIGQAEESRTSAYGNAYTAATTTPPINGVDDVIDLLAGGESGMSATAIGFQLKNNLRGRMNIGDGGPVSVGSGACQITGTLQAYFESAALFNKYLAFTETALAFVCQDANGKAYIFEFPSVKFTDGSRNASGQNGDVIASLSWTAKMHATEGVSIRISRFN